VTSVLRICEEADAVIEYGKQPPLEVLATIRAMMEEFKAVRKQEGQVT
jgi:hypothetical protein